MLNTQYDHWRNSTQILTWNAITGPSYSVYIYFFKSLFKLENDCWSGKLHVLVTV